MSLLLKILLVFCLIMLLVRWSVRSMMKKFINEMQNENARQQGAKQMKFGPFRVMYYKNSGKPGGGAKQYPDEFADYEEVK